MSEWGWVAVGYGATYLSIAGYMMALHWRHARSRQARSVR
jgi:hypothetical protein